MRCEGQEAAIAKAFYAALPVYPNQAADELIDNDHELSPSGILIHIERSGERFIAVVHSMTKVKSVMGQRNALTNKVVGVEGDIAESGAVTYWRVEGVELLLLRDEKAIVPKISQEASAHSATENAAM
jgi:hypothetical protein